MDINIFDDQLTPLGIVDGYTSLIWIRRFFQNGTFELVTPINSLIMTFNIIKIDNDDEVAFIDTINITKDDDNNTYVKINGAFYSAKLKQRVILLSANDLKSLIENNLRGLNIVISDDFGTIPINGDVVGKNLGEVVEFLAKTYNFGYKVIVDKITNNLVFKMLNSVDRSNDQTDNPVVVFSQEYETLQSCEYFNSNYGTINTVYARCNVPSGVVPCTPPYYNIIPDEGVERFEAYVLVDAVTYDVQMPISEGESITVTYLDYNTTLENMKVEAEKALIPQQENFEGDVQISSEYKNDYDLGDVVTIFNDDWAIAINRQITEITEVYTDGYMTATPTFGVPRQYY